MIDGIKILNLPVSNEELLNNLLLNPSGHFSLNTGEVQNFNKKSKYQGLDFTIKTNGTSSINGSLHKFYNKGAHNYDDFHYSSIAHSLLRLQTDFGITPEYTSLNNVEFGINIHLPYSPETFINSVINHKGEPFYPMSKAIIKTGKGIECKHDQYYIKIYDKGAQNELGEHTLRIEIKVIRMKYFHDKKIPLKTLDDLTKRSVYIKLKEVFIKMIENLLICDSSKKNSQSFTDKEQLLIAYGTNPSYWLELKPSSNLKNTNRVLYDRQRKKYYRELENFKNLLEKKGLNKIKLQVKELSVIKWDELIQGKGDKFTDKKGTNSLLQKRDKFTGSNTTEGQIHPIDKKRKCTQAKTCIVTGADISDQQDGSRFISAKKIGYLEAHRIRSKDSDPRRNLKKRIEKYDSMETLFDMKSPDILALSEGQHKILKFWDGTEYEVKFNNEMKIYKFK